MKTIQYTIRKIPEELDQKLRFVSKETSKSLNTLIVEGLEKQFMQTDGKQRFNDLNRFSGCWEDDPEFDSAIDLFNEIDEQAWE